MNNKSCITDVSKFDSTIDSTAVQKITVQDFSSTVESENPSILLDLLLQNTHIEPEDYATQRIIQLVVDGAKSNSKHSLATYENPIARASYIKIPEKDIGCVYIVRVLPNFRNKGIKLTTESGTHSFDSIVKSFESETQELTIG